jgi:3-mercaptopyruvate sulfurtransferase SseA
MQNIINNNEYIIINTLPLDQQNCLIKNTISANNEETMLNEMLYNMNIPDKKIIVYGKNNNDITVTQKTSQLHQHGMKNVYIYKGGLFEWLLLQDIFGNEHFPTTEIVLDILKYKPEKQIF